mmetsp:Transcript_21522/g.46913  ORF Transcript_21522/g.46913 Transcript_21522/m.46913 type:complete len:224 (-) Transcript_21522:523-1194(-)
MALESFFHHCPCPLRRLLSPSNGFSFVFTRIPVRPAASSARQRRLFLGRRATDRGRRLSGPFDDAAAATPGPNTVWEVDSSAEGRALPSGDVAASSTTSCSANLFSSIPFTRGATTHDLSSSLLLCIISSRLSTHQPPGPSPSNRRPWRDLLLDLPVTSSSLLLRSTSLDRAAQPSTSVANVLAEELLLLEIAAILCLHAVPRPSVALRNSSLVGLSDVNVGA